LRRKFLKPNFIGIVGVIMAFISLALPWWTITIDNSPVVYGGSSYSISIYTYQATVITIAGTPTTISIPIWYAWVALVLIVLGGLLGIAGSLIQNARRMLAAGGLLALLSTIIFAGGLQIELSMPESRVLSGLSIGSTKVSLFSSGIAGGVIRYNTYLSFGFWLALVAAVIMLATSLRKPKVNTGTTSPNTHRPTST
jgi:hypothetical protein